MLNQKQVISLLHKALAGSKKSLNTLKREVKITLQHHRFVDAAAASAIAATPRQANYAALIQQIESTVPLRASKKLHRLRARKTAKS